MITQSRREEILDEVEAALPLREPSADDTSGIAAARRCSLDALLHVVAEKLGLDPVSFAAAKRAEATEKDLPPGAWKVVSSNGRLDVVTAKGQRRIARVPAGQRGLALRIAALPKLEMDAARLRYLEEQDVDVCHELLTAAGIGAGTLRERVEDIAEEVRSLGKDRAHADIRAEEARQEAKGRDAAFDDARDIGQWFECLSTVVERNGYRGRTERETFVKIGCVAVKAIRSIDRLSGAKPLDALPEEP